MKSESMASQNEAQLVSVQLLAERMLASAIDMCVVGYDKVTFRMVRDIVLSAPRKESSEAIKSGSLKTVFDKAYIATREHAFRKIDEFESSLTEEQQQRVKHTTVKAYEDLMCRAVYQAKVLEVAYQLFLQELLEIEGDIRSQAEAILLDFIGVLLQDMVFKVLLDNREPKCRTIEEKMDEVLSSQIISGYLGGNRESPERYAITWQVMRDYSHMLPEYRHEAEKRIEELLGSLPHAAVYFPHEVPIRNAIGRFKTGDYSQLEFDAELYKQVTHIRNDEMRIDGWIEHLEYGQDFIDRYTTENAPYISIARDRLARFLGYYPELRHSLQAELYLRDMLADDRFNPDWGADSFDWTAINVTKYREVLLSKGRDAADSSPLFGPKQNSQ